MRCLSACFWYSTCYLAQASLPAGPGLTASGSRATPCHFRLCCCPESTQTRYYYLFTFSYIMLMACRQP
jgi:hypothetical protein